jgi:soluble lytic murein transglycosylase
MINWLNRKIKKIAMLAFLTGSLTFIAGAGRAEVYQFIDKHGTLHFTNVPTNRHFQPVLVTRPPTSSYAQLKNTIHKTGRQYRVDPHLIRAVIKVESDFDPWAVSSAGAQGLMQLMPRTASSLSVSNPFDPEENIDGGTRYLRYLLNLFQGDTQLAVAAYHAGENTVQRFGDIPPVQQTQDYVKKVMKNYRNYKNVEQASQKIYRVVMPEGQVIYTNRPTNYRNAEVRPVDGLSLVQYKP